jgi:hypothetical protein
LITLAMVRAALLATIPVRRRCDGREHRSPQVRHGGSLEPIFWQDGEALALPTLGGDHGLANGVNKDKAGVVVGSAARIAVVDRPSSWLRLTCAMILNHSHDDHRAPVGREEGEGRWPGRIVG